MRLQAFSKKHLLALLLGCSVATSLTGSRAADPLRHAMWLALAPASDPPMYAASGMAAALSAESEPALSPDEARKLRERNAALRDLADHWQAVSEYYYRKNQRLENFQRMYKPIADVACELIDARVVGAGSLSYDRGRLVNAGTRSGQSGADAGEMVAVRGTLNLATSRAKALPPKLAVVAHATLIGRITDSGAFTARVQLVTDKGFQMRGRIRRLISPDRPRTITVTEGSMPRTTRLTQANNARIEVSFQGDGEGMILVPGVKEYHTVLPGDRLYASTAEQNVPLEVLVGEVVKVEPSPDPKDAHRVRLHVRPYANLSRVREVFIISPISASARGQ